MKQLRGERGFAEIGLVAILLVVMIGAGFVLYQRNQSAKTQTQATQTAAKPKAISTVNFSASLTPQGAAAAPATIFTPSTPAIYAVASLNKVAKSTRIEYVRYRDGKYVDNGSMASTKDAPSYASFAWKLKPGTTHPTGKYKVKTYVDGKYQVSSIYTVK